MCFAAPGKLSSPHLTDSTGTCSHSAACAVAELCSKQTWEEDKAFQGFLTSRALSCEKLLAWDPEGYVWFFLGLLLFVKLPWPWMPLVQSWYSHRMKNPTPALHKFLLGGIHLTWLQMSPFERALASFHSQWRGITSFRTSSSNPPWSGELSLLQLQAVQWWPHVRK